MGKKGSAHPADEQRRKEKLKEQKKNAEIRRKQREESLKRRDASDISAEIHKIERMDRLGQADQHMLQRKRKLEEGKEEAIKRAKEAREAAKNKPVEEEVHIKGLNKIFRKDETKKTDDQKSDEEDDFETDKSSYQYTISAPSARPSTLPPPEKPLLDMPPGLKIPPPGYVNPPLFEQAKTSSLASESTTEPTAESSTTSSSSSSQPLLENPPSLSAPLLPTPNASYQMHPARQQMISTAPHNFPPAPYAQVRPPPPPIRPPPPQQQFQNYSNPSAPAPINALPNSAGQKIAQQQQYYQRQQKRGPGQYDIDPMDPNRDSAIEERMDREQRVMGNKPRPQQQNTAPQIGPSFPPNTSSSTDAPLVPPKQAPKPVTVAAPSFVPTALLMRGRQPAPAPVQRVIKPSRPNLAPDVGETTTATTTAQRTVQSQQRPVNTAKAYEDFMKEIEGL